MSSGITSNRPSRLPHGERVSESNRKNALYELGGDG